MKSPLDACFEEQYIEFLHWEVEEATGRMCHERSVTRSHDTVPGRAVNFIKFLPAYTMSPQRPGYYSFLNYKIENLWV